MSKIKAPKVALVTGGNRGIGFETCRQLGKRGYRVILGARDEQKGRDAAARLRGEGLQVESHVLDVTSLESIAATEAWLKREVGRLDVLVNNAGILLPGVSVEDIERSMRTNVYGPYELCRRLIPWMKERGYGRVVNVSSGMGQLSEMDGGYPAYRLSKTALNAVTRVFAAEAAESAEAESSDVTVNSVCPGWVRTDMGGAEAERSPEEGADTLVWLATLPAGPRGKAPNGGFFRDREPIDW